MQKTVVLLVFLVFLWPAPPPARPSGENQGYARVTGPCRLVFPEDHGAHPGYRTEWWYYTGNLRSETGRRFGFQLTFFRSQIRPPGAEKDWPEPASAWRTNQVYLAHAALTDMDTNRHRMAETAARSALGLAGAKQEGGRTTVFVKDWSARIGPDGHRLAARTEGFALDLALVPLKPPVRHGRDGYSRKGDLPEQASCYYSFTRLGVRGKVLVNGETLPVEGHAWMDHEFSSAPLAPGIIGWDWFSLQLDDRRELMLFLLRQKDGSIHPASSGTLVSPSGRARHLARDMFRITPLATWKSPRTGAVYPSRWLVRIPAVDLSLTVTPSVADQEMITRRTTGVVYWEGAVRARGSISDDTVAGAGYVELTGYAGDFDAPL